MTDIGIFPMVTTFLLVILACATWWWKKKERQRLPPGPSWGLPLLGFLPFLSKTDPHIQLEKMKKKYGSVFGMFLGSKYTLFLCGVDSAKEAFFRDEFCDRPEGAFKISSNFEHFGQMNGQPWRDHRKLCSRSLRHLGVGTETLADCARSQIQLALDRLENQAATSGNRTVNFRNAISIATINVTSGMICGRTFPPEQREFKVMQAYLNFFAQNASGITWDAFLPWLKPLMNILVPNKVAMQATFSNMEKLFWTEIESHEKDTNASEQKDFINFYLQEKMKPGNDEKFSRGDMNGNAQLMIFAGTDTVRATVEWFLLCMALHPEIQEELAKEIHEHLGAEGTPNYQEKHCLPLTEAAILESMRYVTIVPLNPVHCTSKETTFRGWNIPTGTIVLLSLYSIHADPKSWPDPELFKPERFLTSDRKSVIVPENFVPFSLGKRICIGDKMAQIESFLFIVSLLQRFRILPPEGGVNMAGNMRITLECKYPIVRLLPR